MGATEKIVSKAVKQFEALKSKSVTDRLAQQLRVGEETKQGRTTTEINEDVKTAQRITEVTALLNNPSTPTQQKQSLASEFTFLADKMSKRHPYYVDILKSAVNQLEGEQPAQSPLSLNNTLTQSPLRSEAELKKVSDLLFPKALPPAKGIPMPAATIQAEAKVTPRKMTPPEQAAFIDKAVQAMPNISKGDIQRLYKFFNRKALTEGKGDWIPR